MNKQSFLTKLEKELNGLPQEDIRKSIEFYSEMICDGIEDGLSEDDAVSRIGSVEEVAKQILMDTPIAKLVKRKIKPQRRLGAWEAVLLILGSPIWLSLLIAAVAVIISVYASLWAVIISLYAVMASLLACGIAGVIAYAVYIFLGKYAQGTFLLGAGIACIGLGILMFFGCKLSVKGIMWISKNIFTLIKSCFVRVRN